LTEPVRDHADPEKLKTILSAVPDVWAEHFVNNPKTLEEYGLDKPEETLTVTRAGGQALTLLIGKESPRKVERRTVRPAPPFGPPMPPMVDMVVEKYRYAKLQDNAQVFEIKADKLKDVFVALDTLRDPQLARFKSSDVRRVELTRGETSLVLAYDKEKSQWK